MRKNIFIMLVFMVVSFVIIHPCHAQKIKSGDILQGKISQVGQFQPSGDVTLAMQLKDGRTIYGRLALVEAFHDATGAAAIVSWMIRRQNIPCYIRIIHEENGFYTVMVNSEKAGSYDSDLAYNMVRSGAVNLDGYCEQEDQTDTSLCTNFRNILEESKNKQRGLWNPAIPRVEYGDMVGAK